MYTSLVGKHIGRTNRNLILWNGAVVLGVMLIATLSSRYLFNCIRGPVPADRTEVLRGDPDDLSGRFVSFAGDETLDTGAEKVERSKSGSERVILKYPVVFVGGRYLVVEAPPEAIGPEFQGTFVPVSPEVAENVISPAEMHEPEVKGLFLPVMLDAKSYRDNAYVGAAFAIPLLLLGFRNVFMFARRSADASSHPIMKRLAKYGPVEAVAGHLDSEAAQGTQAVGKTELTGSWLIHPSMFGLETILLDDVVWIYKKTTQHSVNFVPTGKTYSTLIWDRSGKSHEIKSARSEAGADELLEQIYRRRPWIIGGFSKELEAQWKSDKAAVVNEVARRREAFLSANR